MQSPLCLGGMLLVEDWRPTADLEFLIRDNFPTVFVDKEVYFIVREGDPGTWRIGVGFFQIPFQHFMHILLDDDRRHTWVHN